MNDKLTIKDVEKRTHLEHPDYSQLAQQLLDTMRENERLRETIHQYNIQMHPNKQSEFKHSCSWCGTEQCLGTGINYNSGNPSKA